MHHRAGWPWWVLFLLGLGGGLGLLGVGYGQAGLPTGGDDAAVLEEAKRLSSESTQLYKEGQYAAALSLALRALTIREQALGPTHPDVATSLTNLATLYQTQGQYTEAAPLYQRALAIRERALGLAHPLVATSLHALAEFYRVQGQYAEAAPLHQRALAIREQVLRPMHPLVAQSLNYLAVLMYYQGQYAEAAPLYQRALAIREQALSPAHPLVGESLHHLAQLYLVQGQYAEAAPLHQRALAIREQALGPAHPLVAQSLNNLAVLYRIQGQYAEAAPLLQRALAIQEQALGPTHPNVATSLSNLAGLYQTQGQYAEAAPLLQRALAIREQALGPAHPDVATGLTNLAGLHQIQGQYTEAAPLYQRALAIQEQALGPAHPDVATSLNGLAQLYLVQGQYVEATPLHGRALAIREQALGPVHPLVAQSLNNLAVLAFRQEQYAEAAPLYQRALAIQEQALGPTHPDVATSLTNLATLYRAQGQYTEAALLYQRALTIREQALGLAHPNVADVLIRLAVLSLAQGNPAHAVPLLTRSSVIREHTLALMLMLGTEAQKLASAVMLSNETSLLVSLHTRFAPYDPQALHLALTTVLRRKGRVLDAMVDTLAAMRQHMPPEEQPLLAQWATVRGQLATLVFEGLDPHIPAVYRANLVQLETQVQHLEAQLSAHTAALRTQLQSVTLEQVQATLPAEAALVEFAVYVPFTPPQHWGAAQYVAYVLPAQGAPAWVDLGEAARIDRAIEQFRADLRGPHRLRVRDTARALDALVMRPLRPLLGAAHHLLIAPDGALHLVPFGALLDETQHYLLERFTVSYLTSGRDLLRPPRVRPHAQPPLVVGYPDFDTPGLVPVGQGIAAAPAARRSANLRALTFPPLPGTAAEVAAVQHLLPGSQLWTGSAASEMALKQVQGPRLLHIATHGFFLDDQHPLSHRLRGLDVVSTTLLAELPEPRREHPLLRAGLALAGANTPQPGQEDGLLTALEVASLDLWGTELVVLSACDTGVGQVRNGEGVYGLRRALVMAGADSQVMSLWPVEDDATREFMMAYYRRLQAGAGRAEALRQVQLTMLANPQQGHPFYWAAFVLSGLWTPLTQP